MRKSVLATLVTFSLFLFGCGGGGSDSGGGRQPVANIDQLAGTYKGTMTNKLTGPGGATTFTVPITVVINPDGRVTGTINESTVSLAQCDPTPQLYATSNPLFWTHTLSNCVVVGSNSICSGSETGSAQITGNRLTGTAKSRITCPEGTIASSATFSATKT